MLRKIRLTFAMICFVLITLLFLDFTGTLHGWFGWLAKYNPQNEMFRLLGTKRSFSQNETFFFSHPYPALFRLISHF